LIFVAIRASPADSQVVLLRTTMAHPPGFNGMALGGCGVTSMSAPCQKENGINPAASLSVIDG
jgi:hypothetical protein